MKKGIHPENYRLVVFKDLNNGQTFITRSTAEATETITIEGQEYPLINVHISSSSHPFFTGEERIVDIEGRVDKFKSRVAAGQNAREKRANSSKKTAERKAKREEKAQTVETESK
jgi:large subunit ribosomal protein L31